MSFIPAFMLPVWRSVEMESGKNPCRMAGTAIRHAKLPPPCPTSENDASLARFEHGRINMTRFIQFIPQPGIAVSINIARTQFDGD